MTYKVLKMLCKAWLLTAYFSSCISCHSCPGLSPYPQPHMHSCPGLPLHPHKHVPCHFFMYHFIYFIYRIWNILSSSLLFLFHKLTLTNASNIFQNPNSLFSFSHKMLIDWFVPSYFSFCPCLSWNLRTLNNNPFLISKFVKYCEINIWVP